MYRRNLLKKRPKIVFFFHSLLILRFIYVQTKMWKHAHKPCIFSLLNLFFRYFCLFYRPYCTQTISLDRYLSSFAWFLTVSFLSIKIWLCYYKLYLKVWYYSMYQLITYILPLYYFIQFGNILILIISSFFIGKSDIFGKWLSYISTYSLWPEFQSFIHKL